MTRTGLQVITDALKLLGVVAGHEVPTSAEQQDSFARLNELIDSWGTHAQTLLVARRDVVPLVAGQQVYTIGAGGDVDVPAPMTLDAVSYVLAGTRRAEVFLDVGDRPGARRRRRRRLLTGSPPQVVNYTRDARLRRAVGVAGADGRAGPGRSTGSEPLAQFPDLVTPVALAPGYAKALRTNLAIELAPEFGRVGRPDGRPAGARESLADVKRAELPDGRDRHRRRADRRRRLRHPDGHMSAVMRSALVLAACAHRVLLGHGWRKTLMQYPGFIGATDRVSARTVNAERTINWYPGARHRHAQGAKRGSCPRPASTPFVVLGAGPVRALFAEEGRCFAVGGGHFFEILASADLRLPRRGRHGRPQRDASAATAATGISSSSSATATASSST